MQALTTQALQLLFRACGLWVLVQCSRGGDFQKDSGGGVLPHPPATHTHTLHIPRCHPYIIFILGTLFLKACMSSLSIFLGIL